MAYVGRRNPAVLALGYHLNDCEAADAAARAGIPLILDTPAEFAVGTARATLDAAKHELSCATYSVERWRRSLAISRRLAEGYRSHRGAHLTAHCARSRDVMANTLRYERRALVQALTRKAAAEVAHVAAIHGLHAALDAQMAEVA